VRSFEFHWDDENGPSDESGEGTGVRLRFQIEGVDPDQVTRWIRRNTDGDVTYTITTTENERGKAVELDVTVPITEEELREFRENFRREFPDLRLPESLKIELRHEDEGR
jgi:hypothetical protein